MADDTPKTPPKNPIPLNGDGDQSDACGDEKNTFYPDGGEDDMSDECGDGKKS